jgi:hypothetical protein
MHEDIETVSIRELAQIWCDEYARTTGCDAMILKEEGEWIFIKTPSHEGQPWQRNHLILAIHSLRARKDFGSSMFSSVGVSHAEVGHAR